MRNLWCLWGYRYEHLPESSPSDQGQAGPGGRGWGAAPAPYLKTAPWGGLSAGKLRRLEPSPTIDPYLQPHPPIRVGKESPNWELRVWLRLGTNALSCLPQATLLGLAALNKAYPEALAPGGTACLTPTSPWPCPLPWPWHALSRVSPPGAKDPGALLLEALRSPGLRALEARTAVELLDIFSGLGADGEELAEALAAGNPGAPLPRRAAELREALEQGPRGLALRLWPKLQVVVTLDAGGQAEAVAALGALWCQGLAFFSPAYAASGGQQDSRVASWGQGTGSPQLAAT